MASVQEFSESSQTLLIAAAGTGGHIFPALTIAQELANYPVEIHWLGTPNGMENHLLKDTNIPLHHIQFSGIRHKGIKKWLTLPYTLTRSCWQSFKLIKQIQPQAILVMGGYISAPISMAAKLTRTPLFVHEQNAISGLANRYCALFANKVFEAFSESFKMSIIYPLIRHKILHTGNPIRQPIRQLIQLNQQLQQPTQQPEYNSNHNSNHNADHNSNHSKKHSSQPPIQPTSPSRLTSIASTASIAPPLRITLIGGSLGAQKLNQTVPQAIFDFAEQQQLNINLHHQCGKDKLKETEQQYTAIHASQNISRNIPQNISQSTSRVKITLQEFIDDISEVYAQTDLIIARAGAMSVFEITALQIPAIYIPYPHAVSNHQQFNAKAMQDYSPLIIIPQNQLTQEAITNALNELLHATEPLTKPLTNLANRQIPILPHWLTQAQQTIIHHCLKLR